MTTERAKQIYGHIAQARDGVLLAVGKTCGEHCDQASESKLLDQLVELHNDLLDRAAKIKEQAVALGVPAILMDADPDVRVPGPGVW